MRLIEGGRSVAEAIERFASRGASSVRLGSGRGEAHVYTVYVEAGGEIGPHEARLDQLFIVVEGAGWGAGESGARTPIERGQAAYFERGEIHSKGSDTGMTAIMVQVDALRTAGG